VHKIAYLAPIGAHGGAHNFPSASGNRPQHQPEVITMNILRLSVETNAIIPLMAALPYRIALDPPAEASFAYDPETQLTHFAGRNFSTCRYDESAGGVLPIEVRHAEGRLIHRCGRARRVPGPFLPHQKDERKVILIVTSKA
jgi:hypothetical protein